MAVQISGNDITVPRDGTFTRNVTIGGTLTYEDVTNIDSVGLVTARTGIEIGARPGVAASISVDGNMIVSGISTFGGDVQVPDKIIHAGDTNTSIRFPEDDKISFETAGSEAVRIDASGRLLVGTDTARQTRAGGSSYQPDIQLESTVAGLSLSKFNDSTGPARLTLQKARGSISSPTIVQDNDEIGSLTFSGWDGDTFTNTAQIRSEVDGTPGDDDMPGNLIFYTTSDGSLTTAERLRITSDGNIYTSEDQVRDDARLTITNSKVGVSTSLFLHNNNGSGTATKIAASKAIILSADVEANSGADTSYIAFETDNTEKVRITNSGVVNVKEGQIHLTKQGSANFLKVGQGQNANNYAYIDFIGDSTYTGYGLRLLRGQTGENADSMLTHRGTGSLSIKTIETAPIIFTSSDIERMRITGSGNVGISTGNPTGRFSVGKVGAYLNRDGITVTNPHSSGLKNGVFVLNESGYNSTSTYRAAAFKAVGESGFAVGVSTDQGSNGLGGTLNYSVNFDGKSVQDGSITANGSFYQEDTNTAGDDAQDKTVEFNRRGVFLMLISYSLGTTTTDINRNVYSLGLFVSRSNGATWVPIQQDLTSAQVGNLTISDASVRGKLRIQKSSGSDARACAFRIDVLSSADVAITVTDT